MYKKFYIIEKKRKQDFDLFNKYIEDELQESYKVEINCIKDDSLFLEEHYYLSNKEMEDILKEIAQITESNIIMTFFYEVEQMNIREDNIHNFKLEKIEEILEDLTSIFDIRKINTYFNYTSNVKEKIIKLINSRYRDKTLSEYFKILMDIDEKLYNGIKTNEIENLFIELNRTLLLIVNKKEKIEADNFLINLLENSKKKYDLIKKLETIKEYKYLELKETFSKKTMAKIFKQSKKDEDKNRLLEEIVLDETGDILLEKVYSNLKKYLKKTYGISFRKEKFETFEKLFEKNDLKKLLLEKKNKFKINEKINNDDINKLKNKLSINLIKVLIFSEEDRILDYREELIEFFKIASKNANKNKKTVNLKNEILKIFYIRLFKEFFLDCRIELNENNKEYLRMKRNKVGNIKKDKLKNKFEDFFNDILDIIKNDEILYREFVNKKLMPDKLFNILKVKEKEILKIMQNTNLRNKKKIDKMEEEVIRNVVSIIEKNEIVDLQLNRVLEIIFNPFNIMRETFNYFLDYKGIFLKNEFMKK